jgi:hypothetical protein
MGTADTARDVLAAHARADRSRVHVHQPGARPDPGRRGTPRLEALTEVQLGEDCAAPGGYTSGAYSSGWALIVSRLAACAMGDPLPDAGWPTAVDANAAGG